LLGLLHIVLFGGLSIAFLSLPGQSALMAQRVADKIAITGVINPVTAVLLNFRAYDTMLEMAVLLAAVSSVWSLAPQPYAPQPDEGKILEFAVGIVTPFALMVSGYLLWVGAYSPGGAFQAGSVLAGAGVLVILTRDQMPGWQSGAFVRSAIVLGILTFVAVAAGLMFMGQTLLEYPPEWAGILILTIETATMVSIAAILIGLFHGAHPGKKCNE